MYSAISTACLYPLETEKAMSELLKLGFRRFEIFANCESEFSEDFTKGLLELAKTYGATICSVHLYTCGLEPFMFFTEYKRRFRDSVNQYRHYFERAAFLGADNVVFHGDRKDSLFPIELYCERFDALSRAAKEEGVTLAQENVARCRSGTIKDIEEMKSCLGKNIRFVLDVKQALRAGENPLSMCDAMGENINCVHLSDHTAEHDCLIPGKGSFDIEKLISRLITYGFNGPLTIEVYRSNYHNYGELFESSRFLNNLLTKITQHIDDVRN